MLEVDVGVVQSAEVEVPDHFRLESGQYLVLVIEVGAKEGREAVLLGGPRLSGETRVEEVLVKVDRDGVAMVNAPDEVVDRVAVSADQLVQLVEAGVVDVLCLEADEELYPVRVELFQPVRLDEIGFKGVGEVLWGEVGLR